MTIHRISGIVIAWAGVTVLIGIESLRGFGIEVIGQFAVIGAAVSYAFAAIYGRRFKDLSPLVVATGMLCAATIMMLPLAIVIDQPWNLAPDSMTLLSLFGLAAICTSLAYIIYFHVLSTSGPTNILLVTFLVPISAIVLGTMLLDEKLDWVIFVGMGMIFIGLIAIDGRIIKKLKQRDN